jgi:dynein heavy chain
MKESIQALKKYDYNIDDNYLETIETTYIEWNRLNQEINKIENEIVIIKKTEGNQIMERSKLFKQKLIEFKQGYESKAPFNWNQEMSVEVIDSAYNKIDELCEYIEGLEVESSELNDLEELFNLQKSVFNEIGHCQQKLTILKELWDIASYVHMLFDNWMTISWKKIAFEDMIFECSNLETYLKKLEQKYREFKVFSNTQSKVKTMSKTLELMSDLHSDEMQERHWQELSNETNSNIKHEDPSFCFRDLYKLDLPKYTEKVSDIVEIAKNQTKIKKELDKIKKFWDERKFTWEELPEKETFLLNKTDEIIDAVDQDLGKLLNMLGQKKYITFFEVTGNTLTNELKTINTLVTEFDKLQKNWIKLEPIFTQSADVKANLMETARRFDSMNEAFKNMIKDMRQ